MENQDMNGIDNLELKRYDRQMLLPEIGFEGQLKLKRAKVLVVGAGGLGCPVLQYLAAAGVGELGIIDDDVVELSNLQRQILFNTDDIGKSKAETASAKLKMLNPHVVLKAYNYKLNVAQAEHLIKSYDLVVDGSDNFSTRYLVNDSCVALNKPLVFGSILYFEGQVSVFNYAGGADYRSLFPEAPAAGEVLDCGEGGVIGTLPGIIGSIMANEVIKLICGFGETLSRKLLVFNAMYNAMRIYDFSKEVNDPISVEKTCVPATVTVKESITLEELRHLQTENKVCLVDVREPYEFEERNIGGINIPLYDLPQKAESLPENKTIVFYCESGKRSRIAAKLLKNKHKEHVYSLLIL